MKTRKHRYVRIPLDEGKHRFVLHLRADWISGARRAAPGHHLRGPGRRQDGRELRRHEPRYLAGRKVRRDIEARRSEEHTSELQSLMRISYAVFCLKKKKKNNSRKDNPTHKLQKKK